MAQGMIMRRGGGSVTSKLPNFTYTGAYTLIDDGDGNWHIDFSTSGTLVITSGNVTIDAFLVGGGGSGARGGYSSGGGAGYTQTYSSVALTKNMSYSIVVGAGGAAVTADSTNGNTGGQTWLISIGTYYVNGGNGGYQGSSNSTPGGDGGSGGGAYNCAGGADGSNGGGAYGGTGQGTTTKKFSETSGTLYAQGGGGNHGTLTALLANSGNGGNATDSSGTAGSSGICSIRNHRAA